MLVIISVWIIFSVVFLALGEGFNFLCKLKNFSIVERIIIGIPLAYIMLSITNFILPLSQSTLIVILSLSTLFLALNFKSYLTQLKKFEYNNFDFYLLLILAVYYLFGAVTSIENYDSGLYHVQAIEWITQLPVIKGSANLHGRLATQSSMWLLDSISKSLFNCYGINSFLGIIFSFYLLSQRKLNNFIKYLFLIAPFFFWRWTSSPSNDYTAMIIALFCLIFYLKYTSSKKYKYLILLSVFALYAFTVKLSLVIYFLLIPAGIFYDRRCFFSLIKKKPYTTVCLVLISSTLIMSYVAKSILISGYLIYPYYKIDLFDFVWKLPIKDVQYMNYVIRNCAKMIDLSSIPNISNFNWVLHWWRNKEGYGPGFNVLGNRVLLTSSILSSITASVFILYKTKSYKRELLLILVLIIGLLFWFVTAPDFRFGYVFIYPLLVISTNLIFITITISWAKKFVKLFVFLLSAKMLLVNTIYHKTGLTDIKKYLITPKTYEEYSGYNINYKRVRINNFVVNTPYSGELTWDIPLPSANPDKFMTKNLYMVDSTDIRKGFFVKD